VKLWAATSFNLGQNATKSQESDEFEALRALGPTRKHASYIFYKTAERNKEMDYMFPLHSVGFYKMSEMVNTKPNPRYNGLQM
jgi:hypothetical protein